MWQVERHPSAGMRVGSVGGTWRLLAAAGELSDAELAVALQGLLCRRPAIRQVLLSVWQAEEAKDSLPFDRVGWQAVPADVKSDKGDSGAGPLCSNRPTQEPPADEHQLGCEAYCVGGDAARRVPVLDLRRRVTQYALQSGCFEVGTEHVMAAALEALPEHARAAFGEELMAQLLELLEKSQLAPPPRSGTSCHDGGKPEGAWLPVQEGAVPLLALLLQAALPTGRDENAAAEFFRVVQELPDQASAVQLLEMAKIFAERSAAAG